MHGHRGRVGGRLLRWLAVAASLAFLVGAGPVLAPGAGHPGTEEPRGTSEQTARKPNIVLILMDDFSTELLRTMPNAQRMRARGAAYRNAFVVDSMCCPSRASIFTGQPPHQTGVLTNSPNHRKHPIGGFEAFEEYGNEAKAFNVALKQGGYTTGFVGKYMNRYEARVVNGVQQLPPKVRGWDSWEAILGGGYNGWQFNSTRLLPGGRMVLDHHPAPALTDPRIDRSYATNVASHKALDFIEEQHGTAKPYFLEVAVYGPHFALDPVYPGQPLYPAAMADRAPPGHPGGGNCGLRRCGKLTLRDLPGYDDPRGDNAPTYLRDDGSVEPAAPWRTNKRTLTRTEALKDYRNRARMVQSIDRMIGRILRAVGPDTYVVLTSDNGFHLGQHQLNGGKGTPYDSDTRVPLVVVGPGVSAGPREQFVSNIDLAPTIEELAGLEPPFFRSGISFAKTLRRPDADGARYAFFEHTYALSVRGQRDPDKRPADSTKIVPSYVAVRGEEGLLARVDLDSSWIGTDYAWELYRYDVPWEDTNVFATDHEQPWAQDLMQRLLQWDGCGPAGCRAARGVGAL